jgi:predicted 3-demethylubiquinone-9 3-methyltransferase (glyoxalase superfamily)
MPSKKTAARKKTVRKTSTRKTATSRKQMMRTCLWFDSQGEEAARFYTGIFKNSRIGSIVRYSKVGYEIHKQPAGSVMTVEFQLNDMKFMALNGGPLFKFNEAISIEVHCETQQEIDYYWDRLGAGGDPAAQVCGWLKDKYGLSWQIVPKMLGEMYTKGDPVKAQRAFAAMMQMKKLDIAALKKAYDGR